MLSRRAATALGHLHSASRPSLPTILLHRPLNLRRACTDRRDGPDQTNARHPLSVHKHRALGMCTPKTNIRLVRSRSDGGCLAVLARTEINRVPGAVLATSSPLLFSSTSTYLVSPISSLLFSHSSLHLSSLTLFSYPLLPSPFFIFASLFAPFGVAPHSSYLPHTNTPSYFPPLVPTQQLTIPSRQCQQPADTLRFTTSRNP